MKFLLGLINSALLNWFFRISFPSNNHIASNQLAQLPIIKATESQQTKIAEIVDEIIEAKKQDATTDTSKLECKIDELVYQLYGLTDEEIRIVEGKA